MSPRLAELVELMGANRLRHGKRWRTLRADRVEKLFPDLDPPALTQLLWEGIDVGVLEAVTVVPEDGTPIPALKLADYGGWCRTRFGRPGNYM